MYHPDPVSGTYDEIWGRRVSGDYGSVKVNYISLPHLLVNKKASGRPQDLADFAELSSLYGDTENAS